MPRLTIYQCKTEGCYTSASQAYDLDETPDDWYLCSDCDEYFCPTCKVLTTEDNDDGDLWDCPVCSLSQCNSCKVRIPRDAGCIECYNCQREWCTTCYKGIQFGTIRQYKCYVDDGECSQWCLLKICSLDHTNNKTCPSCFATYCVECIGVKCPDCEIQLSDTIKYRADDQRSIRACFGDDSSDSE